MTSEPELEVCPTCGALPCDWVNTPATPATATEEREAVAVAALINALKQAGGYPATISHLKSGKFSDSISVRIAIAAIMDASAAEILAAETNERARIVAWLRATSTGLDLTKRRIADAIERNEHGADTNKQSGVPVPSNHEGVNLVALCLAMARIKELNTALNGIVPSPLCGESWNLPDKETVQITVTFGALKAARLALTNSINVATS